MFLEESLRSQIDLLLKVRDVGLDEAEMGVYTKSGGAVDTLHSLQRLGFAHLRLVLGFVFVQGRVSAAAAADVSSLLPKVQTEQFSS